mmetsp:Transcript_14164/g.23605  ORF Transcript_14164/g.23605 Transcript_14164/m.23605 type:complete len:91 (-) Transcript_14164:1140-1412(-)
MVGRKSHQRKGDGLSSHPLLYHLFSKFSSPSTFTFQYLCMWMETSYTNILYNFRNMYEKGKKKISCAFARWALMKFRASTCVNFARWARF